MVFMMMTTMKRWDTLKTSNEILLIDSCDGGDNEIDDDDDNDVRSVIARR